MDTAWFWKGNSYTFGAHLERLNPTGRWKIQRNLDGDDNIYIEHKWRFFKDWVSECAIEFIPAGYGEIVDCRNKVN